MSCVFAFYLISLRDSLKLVNNQISDKKKNSFRTFLIWVSEERKGSCNLNANGFKSREERSQLEMNWSVFEASCGPGTINDGASGYKGSGGGWGKGQWPPIKREEKEGDDCQTRTRMGTIYNHTWINHTQKNHRQKNLTFWPSFIFQICTKLSSTRFSPSSSAK